MRGNMVKNLQKSTSKKPHLALELCSARSLRVMNLFFDLLDIFSAATDLKNTHAQYFFSYLPPQRRSRKKSNFFVQLRNNR